jgi:hypothetical protein
MNDWQLNTWKHLNDLCLNWWVGIAMGTILGAMIVFLIETFWIARNTRRLINDIKTKTRGQPGETCVVCGHTRAEGYRFVYPFNQSVCSNCMVDDPVISNHVGLAAQHIVDIGVQVEKACAESRSLHDDPQPESHSTMP